MDTEVRLGKARLDKSKNNKKGTSQSAEPIPYKEIIDYLNKKTGQNLHSTTKSYQRLIKARWNEGYTLQDFKTVIDNKAFEWQGTEFWKYMVPRTLFASSHFDDYLNANKLKPDSAPASGGYGGDLGIRAINDDDLPF